MGTLIENINAISKIKADLNKILRENGSDGGPVFMDYPDKFRELFRIVDDYADATEDIYVYQIPDAQTVVPDPVITYYQNVVTITCSLDKAIIRYWVKSDSGNNDIGLNTLQKGSTIYLSENSTVYCYAQYREEKSNEVSLWVPVDNIEIPIPPVIERDGTTVTITSEQGYDIYYKIGSGGTYYQYTEPITVARTEDVYSFTRGYRANSNEVVDKAPEQPTKPLPPVITCSDNIIIITCETENVSLYYKEENGRWMPYTGPISITKSGFYYAKSVNSYYMEAISNKKYCEYIAPVVPGTNPEIPVITCSNNIVTITCSTIGADIFYSIDGSNYSKYTQPINIQANTNFWAFSLLNDKTSSITGPYLAEYISAPPVIPNAPEISCSNNMVIITCSTIGANIYYSTDNHNFTQYTQPIEIQDDTTFWAYSSLNGQISSVSGPYYAEYDNINYLSIPLTFKILENGQIGWKRDSGTQQNIEYRINYTGEWTTLASTTDGSRIMVNNGDIVEFRGNNYNAYYGEHRFISNCNFNIYGNIMSLVDPDNYENITTVGYYVFHYLFLQCSKLLNANKLQLPGITIDNGCYYGMFSQCTSLINPPELLPALSAGMNVYRAMFYGCTSLVKTPVIMLETFNNNGGTWGAMMEMFEGCTSLTIAYDLNLKYFNKNGGCCNRMFRGCTSLVNAPALPATELKDSCYEMMFYGCTSLVNAPALPATVLGENCYSDMFRGCTSLVNAPALPATTMKTACYSRMFMECTSLVNAPVLNGVILNSSCYSGMFANCTSLVNAPTLSVTTLYNNCYSGMFGGCTSLVNAPALPATVLAEGCYSNMFEGCTSLVNAPDLPATILLKRCYYQMFKDCTNLNYVKCMATYITYSVSENDGSEYNDCTQWWLYNVSATGTFVKNSNMKYNVYSDKYHSWFSGENGIPTRWTRTDAA